MAGTLDRRHRFVTDGGPVVTGFAAVGDAYRGLIEMVVCTALPQEVVARPAVAAAMARLPETLAPPPQMPGPDRGQLLGLLAS